MRQPNEEARVELKRQLGLRSSIMVVIASMIGTGIFITTGTVLEMTRDSLLVLALWGVGGVIALTGTLCYAELATMWPHVGGEYVYLKKTYGFLPSFLSGWISLVVGFSASIAISAITLIEYLDTFWQNVTLQAGNHSYIFSGRITQKLLASAVLMIFGMIHIHGVKSGSRIQNVLTVTKVIVVLALIGLGLYMADWTQAERLAARYPNGVHRESGALPLMGLSLLIIMFSYSGWNGATYMAGEIKDAERNLPKALFIGTLLTTVLYIGLNVVFLISSSGLEIMGQHTIGSIAASNLFGRRLSALFTMGITLILLSSISVQMMIGPRVYYAMAKDGMMFSHLSRVSPRFHTPTVSIVIQMILSIFYVVIGNARLLMEYMGFALGIFPVLTVIGLVYLRYRHPEIPRPYKVPLFPVTPVVFVLLSIGMMVAGFMAWTETSKFAVIVLAAGIPVYLMWRFINRRRPKKSGRYKPSSSPSDPQVIEDI